ncbi:MAG: heme-binding protein [Methylovulum sp.]|nr:MAG: heme-binding protein [Methylovulum sp.]
MNNKIYKSAIVLALALTGNTAFAKPCDLLPTRAALETALKAAQSQGNGGFGLHMWATMVDRTGVVCAIARSGANSGEQWPGSRVISAQKANTANAFSLPGLALSTANLYTATQPGGSLYGLQESNPVHVDVAYAGDFAKYGTDKDALIGRKIGGVNVFGGGLALYDVSGRIIGGIGVSGDSSCADHNIAWRTRFALGLDHVPAGVATAGDDNIVYDISNGDTSTVSEVPSLGKSAGGWGHPACSPAAKAIAEGFHKAGSGSL